MKGEKCRIPRTWYFKGEKTKKCMALWYLRYLDNIGQAFGHFEILIIFPT